MDLMRRRLLAIAALFAATVAWLVPAEGVAGATSLPPVRGLHGVAVDGPGVTLSWRWPSSTAVKRAFVVYAYGGRAPQSPGDGDDAGVVPRSRHGLTVYGLVPQSRYSFAVFAAGHGRTSTAATVTVRTGDEPEITSTSLPDGVVGASYTAHLTAANSSAGTWSVPSGQLPAGLSLAGATISGTPQASGTSSFQLRYVDQHGSASYAGTSITVDPATPSPSPTPSP